jgi:hypothetical protein
MAQLPGERFLIQQIGSQVVLFDRHAEALAELGIAVPNSGEIVRFDPASRDATAKAQKVINDAPELNDEECLRALLVRLLLRARDGGSLMAKYFCTCRFCGQLFACSNPNEDDCGRHGVPR